MTFVRTPTDYHAALREIEYLWGSEPDTDEGRKLDEYLASVDEYEDANKPTPELQG